MTKNNKFTYAIGLPEDILIENKRKLLTFSRRPLKPLGEKFLGVYQKDSKNLIMEIEKHDSEPVSLGLIHIGYDEEFFDKESVRKMFMGYDFPFWQEYAPNKYGEPSAWYRVALSSMRDLPDFSNKDPSILETFLNLRERIVEIPVAYDEKDPNGASKYEYQEFLRSKDEGYSPELSDELKEIDQDIKTLCSALRKFGATEREYKLIRILRNVYEDRGGRRVRPYLTEYGIHYFEESIQNMITLLEVMKHDKSQPEDIRKLTEIEMTLTLHGE